MKTALDPMAKEGTCDRCQRTMPIGQLNAEARIHHGARELLCNDRKGCERAARKAKR